MLSKEELKNTYIRYTPEITEEIFNKIIERLDKLFPRANRYGIVPNNFEYYTFNSDYKCLWICKYREEVCFSLDNHTNGDNKEIFPSDILGEPIQEERKSVTKDVVSTFPEEGSCKYYKELAKFLKKKFPHYVPKNYSDQKFIAWNTTSWWYCNTSSKELFTPDVLDKFVIKNEPMKEIKEWWKDLKKGDYVVCIKEASEVAHLNLIYKVDHVDEDGWVSCFQEKGGVNGHKYIYYRKPTKKEISMYVANGNKPVDVTTYVIPEDEGFILPDKWYIRFGSKKQFNILMSYPLFAKYFIDYVYNSPDRVFTSQPEYYSYPEDVPKGYTEITFEQFKKYVMKEKGEEVKNKIPEYVECTENAYGLKKGNIYKVDSEQFIIGVNIQTHYSTMYVRPSTKEAYDAQFKKSSTDEELLEEAKRRYPVGTKFYPAHLNQKAEYCIVTNTRFNTDNNGDITILTDEGSRFNENDKYGNSNYNRIVYRKYINKWAEIVEHNSPPEEQIKEWSVGTCAVGVEGRTGCMSSGDQYKVRGKIFTITSNSTDNINVKETTLKEKEMKFEKGKWYKYKHPDGLFFLKSSKNVSGNTIFYSEYICTTDGEHEIQSSSYNNNFVTDEEVSLEEIQLSLDDIKRKATPEEIQKSNGMKSRHYSDYVGKWYVYPSAPKFLCYIKSKDKRYGFNMDGKWFDTTDMCNPWSYTEATKEVVEEKLLEYAKKMYPVGIRVNSTGGQHDAEVTKKEFTFRTEKCIENHGNCAVYTDGRWAEIVSKSVEEKQFPLIEDNQFKVGDTVEIINQGKIFSTYDVVFKELNFINKERNNAKSGDKGTIFHICRHEWSGVMLAINLNNGKQVLIHKEGVELLYRLFPWRAPSQEDCIISAGMAMNGITQPKKRSKLKIVKDKKQKLTHKKVNISNKHLIIINI